MENVGWLEYDGAVVHVYFIIKLGCSLMFEVMFCSLLRLGNKQIGESASPNAEARRRDARTMARAWWNTSFPRLV